jgi:hypothetical protein
MGVEITDGMVDAYRQAEFRCHPSRLPRGCCIRAGLPAVVPLIAERVRAEVVRDEEDFEASIRADERRKVAEEFAAEFDKRAAECQANWEASKFTVEGLGYAAGIYASVAGVIRDLRVPYCGNELHGADGGKCPGCGFDPYAITKEPTDG